MAVHPTSPTPGGTRGSKKSSNSKHSAKSSDSGSGGHGKKKKKPANPPQTPRELRKELSTSQSLSNSGHIINDPTPIYKPYIAPGVPGKPGTTLYVGNLSPDETVQPGNKWRFVFHWNPSEIDLDTSASYAASAQPKATYTDNAHALFVATTSLSFQVMIERQEEVFLDTPLGHEMNLEYGSNSPHGVKAKTFGEVGTTYDLEFLYKAINGPIDNTAVSLAKGSPAISAPYILANPMFLTFGKSIQFYGYVNDLAINHIMFTPKMVPTVTYLQISMTAYSLKNLKLQTAIRTAKAKKNVKQIIHHHHSTNPKGGPVIRNGPGGGP